MKRSTLLQTALLTCGLSFSAASIAAGASGEMLGNTCAGCHGTNGVSTGPASPSLAGIDYDYMIESMKQFRAGERNSTIMKRIAKGYDDADIEAMSKYFSEKKFVMASQEYDKAAAKRGKKLHRKFCKNCHGDNGYSEDTDDDSGVLAGQWKPYLNYTFTDYKAGDREMGKKMKKKFKSLHKKAGDKGVADLIEFYASQK